MQEILYRFWDADGLLLYVGISKDFDKRTTQHQKGSSWYEFHAQYKIQEIPMESTAIDYEKFVVQTEKPLFNIQHYIFSFDEKCAHVRKQKEYLQTKRAQRYLMQTSAIQNRDILNQTMQLLDDANIRISKLEQELTSARKIHYELFEQICICPKASKL